MKTRLKMGLAAVLFSGMLCAAAVQAKVLASAGSEKITEEEFALKVKEAESKQSKALNREEKISLLKALLNQRLLVAEARAQGLEKDPEVKRAIADGTRQVMANTLFDREVSSQVKVGEDEVKDFYKNNPMALELARASHILVKVSGSVSEADAKKKAEDIYRQVKGDPAKFAEVARKVSDDQVSRERGGDLGSFGHGAMVPEFDKAVFAAKVGDFIPPIKTQFGYHVIYLVEKRLPALEEASAAITQELTRRKTADLQNEYLGKLAKKHKTKLSEDLVH